MYRPKLIILVGLPGSGKTTYAKQFMNVLHLSSDAIRAELYGNESIQGNPSEVFSLMQKMAINALHNGQDVIYDATNITRKDRACIINICPKFAKIECRIVWAPIETCIERDANRERTVGRKVIDRMLKRFQAPFYDEGIDEINIVMPTKFNQDDYVAKIVNAMKIPHDNPHHTLDIFDHCRCAMEYSEAHDFDYSVCYAAVVHDCGKPYVKSFVNTKGEQTDVAHYYQHQCVGAWMSYVITYVARWNVSPEVAWLVSTHMAPFLNEKYYNNLPKYLKESIDKLHEADLAAH